MARHLTLFIYSIKKNLLNEFKSNKTLMMSKMLKQTKNKIKLVLKANQVILKIT